MTALTQVLYCFITFFDELYLSEGFRKGKRVTLNFAISKALKQFGNVTKFLFGQPLGRVKGAPRKDRGHKDRLDSIFPRQNHLFYGVEMTALTKVLYCFITFFDEL
jgi:hypothetical protein